MKLKNLFGQTMKDVAAGGLLYDIFAVAALGASPIGIPIGLAVSGAMYLGGRHLDNKNSKLLDYENKL